MMPTELEITERQELFLSHFRQQEAQLLSSEPAWLTEQRQDAIQSFQDAEFPTTQDEDWRYTNVSPIIQTAFRYEGLGGQSSPESAEISAQAKSIGGDGPVTARLVFVNGHYSEKHSSIGSLPAGVRIGSLRTLLRAKDADGLRVYLGRTLNLRRQAFTSLNAALWQDGAFVLVPQNVALTDPVQLVYLSTAQGAPTAAHSRTLIVAERNAQVTVAETFQAGDDGICFSNAVTEIVAGENAVVDYYHSVRENNRSFHIGLVQAYAGHAAQISALAVSLSGALVRNEVRAVLDAEGADCTLNGLYLAKGVQHVDNHTTIDHAKPHGSSRQVYNGILDGHATAVFNGRVIVRPDAQKTDANQKNRNLLLSADATIDTKPQLEISANDVRCTHGATVGQMDPEALFFLRSRGLQREEAVALLIQAFAGEILDKVKPEGLRHWLEGALRTEFSNASVAGK